MRSFIKFICTLVIIIAAIFISMKYFETDKKILGKLYPRTYLDYVETASQKYNVDKYLIFSIIKNESNFNNSISSNKGAKGLMQLLETTAAEVAGNIGYVNGIDLSNPEINIEIGTKYYSTLYKKYQNAGLALAAYNAGSGNVDKWIETGIISKDGTDIENIPYKETNMYVRKVLQTERIYNYIYE